MKSFEQYLEQKNISPAIIKRYLAVIVRFEAFSPKDLANRTKKDVLDYLQFLQHKALDNRTRQQDLGVLKHYYNYLQSTDQISSNPTSFIHIRGIKKKLLYKLLTQEDLHDFATLYYEELEDKRNYLILTLCLFQGLHVSEWKALKVKDINLQKGTVFIEKRLRSNARTLTLQAFQIGEFYAFLNQQDNPDKPLFTTTPDVQKWVIKLRKRYPAFSDFKQIRASIITYWIQTEGLRKAQYKAGHRYISSTEAYLSNDLRDLQDNLNRFHPLK